MKGRSFKKWSIGLLIVLLGLTVSAKADVAMPVWNALLQTQASVVNGGNSLNIYFQHIRLKGTFSVDDNDTLVLMPEMAGGTFTILDAYDLHKFADIQGLSVKAGQFKVAFGDDRYSNPDQLKRVTYAGIDALIPGGATAKAWDMGLEVKEQIESVSVQANVIQGAGPNALADNNGFKDFTGRVEWKTPDFALGVSDYYGLGGQTSAYTFTTQQNWFGAHGRLMVESLDFRAEAVWAPTNLSGYDTQLSFKPVTWFEPVVWFETTMNSTATTANNLGLGLNFWAGDKTRVSVDASYVGLNDILSSNQLVFQVEDVF